jgi:hypothetical protein
MKNWQDFIDLHIKLDKLLDDSLIPLKESFNEGMQVVLGVVTFFDSEAYAKPEGAVESD